MAGKKNGSTKGKKGEETQKELINTHIHNSLNLKCKNKSQKDFVNLIEEKEITFGYGCAGTGKAQPLSSKILTPSGYTTMGVIKEGDLILGEDGDSYSVLQTHPQGEKDVYRIEFSDGSFTECTEDHIWFTKTEHDRNFRKKVNSKKIKTPKSGSTKTLRQIKDTLYTKRGRKNHSIPLTNEVQFNDRNVTIPSYTLGCLLGDGCLTQNPTITTNDELIINNISEELSKIDENISVTKHSHSCKNNYGIRVNGTKENWVTLELNKLGLMNTKSDNKFIPDLYKINSVRKRKEVLKGLLDTDGYISKQCGAVYYYTISKKLAEDVGFIVNSLGGHYTINEKFGKYKNDNDQIIECNKCYILKITLPDDEYFKLGRKQDLIENKNRRNLHARFIKNIEYVGKKEVKCITTSNPKGLYITDDFIVTHNSYLSLFKALQLLKNHNNKFKKIIVAKPIVDVEESIGFLPGTQDEKLRPYVMSSLDIIDKVVGEGAREKLEEDGFLEFIALAHIRGINIENSIMIMEEAQNMSPLQMKTLLTRIGEDSKFIVSGDLDQSDRYRDVKKSGLYDALEKHDNIEEVGMHKFDEEDIVRNPIVTKILNNYKNDT